MESATLNRAYALLDIKSVEDDARVITGIATTPTADRLGDVVDPKGAQFRLPLPLLWQHDAKSPIGNVTAARVTDAGIEITAQIAKGVSAEIDRAWSLIKAGLVRGLSIGFKGLEAEPIKGTYGVTFKAWEWLELSAVTIPANHEATIVSIKQFADGLQGATAQAQTGLHILPGVSGKQTISLRPKDARKVTRTIQEQIAALEAKRAATAARMAEIMQKAAEENRTSDEAEQEEFDGLEAELAPIDADLKRFRTLEKAQVSSAAPVGTVTTVRDAGDMRTPSAYRAPVQLRNNHAKGTGFIRLMISKWIGAQEGRPAADIARERFGDMPDVEMVLRSGLNAVNWVERAAVAAGTTTDSAWAAPLVVVNNLASEFLESLWPATILGRIPGIRRVPFNISVPRTLTDTTGYWVSQGSPKPVSAMTFDTVTLRFNKLAGISVITEELARFSSPAAEGVVATSLRNAIVYKMDRDLLDPTVAEVSGVNPASLTYNVTPTTATGTTADAFRDDFASMMATYLTNNMSMSGVVLVMTSAQALKLSLMRNTLGGREFEGLSANGGSVEGIPVITSENIVATGGSPTDGYPIIAINAPEILLADDGGVSIDMSREASLQMDSAPDSPATASTVMVSLWQTNQIGLKAERFVTWAKGRSQAVQFIQNAKYA
jgi:HK97 family phage major capsid protein/HK97 family phage prohead protease